MKLNYLLLLAFAFTVISSGCVQNQDQSTTQDIGFDEYSDAVDRHVSSLEDRKYVERGGIYHSGSDEKEYIEFEKIHDAEKERARANYTRNRFPMMAGTEEYLHGAIHHKNRTVESQVYRESTSRKDFIYSKQSPAPERNRYYAWDFNDAESDRTEVHGLDFNPVGVYHSNSLIPPGFMYGVEFEEGRNLTLEDGSKGRRFNASSFHFESDEDLARYLGSAFSLEEWAYSGNVSGSLLIDEEGIIREYRVKIEDLERDRNYKANYTIEFTDKEIKKPEWYEKAKRDLRS